MNMRVDRRIAPRPNTNIKAEIVFEGGRSVRPCIVRNLSELGAKLEVAMVAGIPNTFDLMIAGHPPRPCRVVWRALKEIGVAFVTPEHR
ncbi:MAG: PilZ domain-containing protein [Devosia sp.]|nr:PilZ domain-containing protein [Devosia sp.]